MSNKYYYLYEQTKVANSHNIEILNESVANGKPKIAFRTILQEADVKNQNKRRYSQSICEGIVAKLEPKVSNRSLLMEVDHPIFASSDPATLKQRSTVVELNNCGAKIDQLRFDSKSKQIIGEISTLSGFKGPDLAGLIKDSVNFGFSLRALGSVEQLSDGSIQVVEPMIPITYDAVSNPSYANARILEILPESLNDFISNDQTLLCENEDFKSFIETERIQLCENTVVTQFINQIINENMLSIITKKIHFKI